MQQRIDDNEWPNSERIRLIRFLVGCRKRLLNHAPSVFYLIIGFFWDFLCYIIIIIIIIKTRARRTKSMDKTLNRTRGPSWPGPLLVLHYFVFIFCPVFWLICSIVCTSVSDWLERLISKMTLNPARSLTRRLRRDKRKDGRICHNIISRSVRWRAINKLNCATLLYCSSPFPRPWARRW